MAYDYSKLEGKIVEVCGTKRNFAKKMGLSAASITAKLKNKTKWSQQEISEACKLLHIRRAEVAMYFFCEKS